MNESGTLAKSLFPVYLFFLSTPAAIQGSTENIFCKLPSECKIVNIYTNAWEQR